MRTLRRALVEAEDIASASGTARIGAVAPSFRRSRGYIPPEGSDRRATQVRTASTRSSSALGAPQLAKQAVSVSHMPVHVERRVVEVDGRPLRVRAADDGLPKPAKRALPGATLHSAHA